MSVDTYSMNDKAARCAGCGLFMPWSRSRQAEADSGIPAGAPALVETGLCERCEAANDNQHTGGRHG